MPFKMKMLLTKQPRRRAKRALWLAALLLGALLAAVGLPRPSANLADPPYIPPISLATSNASAPTSPWALPRPGVVTPTLLAPFVIQLVEEGLTAAEYYAENADDFECEDCDLYFLEHYLLPLLPGCREAGGAAGVPPQRTALIVDPDPQEADFVKQFIEFHCPGVAVMGHSTPAGRAAVAAAAGVALAVVERRVEGGSRQNFQVPKQPQALPVLLFRTAAPAEAAAAGGGGLGAAAAAARLAVAGYQLFTIAYDGLLAVDLAFFVGGGPPLGCQEGQCRAPSTLAVLEDPPNGGLGAAGALRRTHE